MSTGDIGSNTRPDFLTIRAGQSIGSATWVTACFSLGGIAGIIWQAYAAAPTIPPTALGFIWVLAAMSVISLLGAGRELYIREGIRIASEYAARFPSDSTSSRPPVVGPASTTTHDDSALVDPRAAAETASRPVVVATHELHLAVDANDPDGEPFELEYLAFHNLGPEAAFNIFIDPIMVAEERITLFGSSIKLLKRDDTSERQIRGSLRKKIREAQRGSAVGTRLPLNVRYEDRGGKEWATLHVVEVTNNGIEIGPVGDRKIYWTKLL